MIRNKHSGFFDKRREGSHFRSWHKHKRPLWFADWIGRRAPRIERGDARYLILDALAEKARHGYEIIQTIEERSRGAYRPSPGTVYPTLQMLEDIGAVCSREEVNRKTYELTAKGREQLEAHRFLVEDFYDNLGHGPSFEHTEIFDDMQDQIMKMFKLITKSFQWGRLDQNKTRKIQKVIEDAVQRIDEILKSE